MRPVNHVFNKPFRILKFCRHIRFCNFIHFCSGQCFLPVELNDIDYKSLRGITQPIDWWNLVENYKNKKLFIQVFSSVPCMSPTLSWLIISGVSITPILSRRNLKALSESRSAVSDTLRPHGLDSPWTSPGQNTEVGVCSLHQPREPKSSTFWADSLPAEPPGKSKTESLNY